MKIRILTMLLLAVIILASGCTSTQNKPSAPTEPTNVNTSAPSSETHPLQSANISAEKAEYGGGTPSMPGVPAPDPDPAYIMLNNTTYGGGTASMPGVPAPDPDPQYIMVGNNTTTIGNNTTAVGNNTTM